ncbi:MAG TPA: hypothetical protein DCL41_07230 [Bdellovibrionales bacterium]|nr:hypothetical protein [Pseudobdellovibrionaceae bacterium]HAG91647.1 hypothetical protein [Bdellovibrionales bacterium]|tara:strand:- start:554 stop:1084 length:531 start_codon:yes stop_codon:yes gene_type:complete
MLWKMWVAFATLFLSQWVMAKGPDYSIFEVRRQLALSNDEKTEKDFYIYAGKAEGIREGAVYDVVRRVPLYDGFQNRSLGEVSIKVAQVKVIFVDQNVSIARHFRDFSRAALPVLRDNYILLGDVIDPDSAKNNAGSYTPIYSTQDTASNEPQQEDPNAVKLVINSIDLTDQAYSR